MPTTGPRSGCEKVHKKMAKLGIRPERLQLEWISAAEGIRFADVMRRLEALRRDSQRHGNRRNRGDSLETTSGGITRGFSPFLHHFPSANHNTPFSAQPFRGTGKSPFPRPSCQCCWFEENHVGHTVTPANPGSWSGAGSGLRVPEFISHVLYARPVSHYRTGCGNPRSTYWHAL